MNTALQMHWKKFILIACWLGLGLIPSACSNLNPNFPKTSVEEVFSPVKVKRPVAIQATPAEINKALIPDFDQTLSRPRITPRTKTFNLSVHDLPAREFFMGLIMDTSQNIIVHPDVTGSISLELKNVTLPQVLDAVQKVYGYDYKKSAAGYIVYPATLQTKIYAINRLDLVRKGLSKTRVSSGQLSNSKNNNYNNQYNNQSSTNNRNQTQNSGSWIDTKTQTDFWQELETSLKTIVSVDDQAHVIINRQSGVIVVRAKPMQQREVENFLNKTQTRIEKQVLIEAKILEIILNEGNQDGVNWANIVREGTEMFLTSSAPLPSAIAATQEVFTIGIKKGDFTAFIELLETQGKTNILSSPRISTLNNQKAIIKVGQDEYFITDISSSTVATGSSTIVNPDITWTPFFSGIALDVTPQIDDDDEITLHIHPSITRVEDQTKKLVINDKETELPLALNTVRESDSIVHARNGQIIVIGGLMQETDSEDKRGVAFLTQLPYLGNLFRVNTGNKKKSELVILLKPTVITSNADWQRDLAASKQRMQELEDFQMWKDLDLLWEKPAHDN